MPTWIKDWIVDTHTVKKLVFDEEHLTMAPMTQAESPPHREGEDAFSISR
jgi:hypothetical protein